MSSNQNNATGKKLEEKNRKATLSESTMNKPIKKIDSSILDRIEKKNSSSNLRIEKRSTLKELELQELEKIEKLSTFKKLKNCNIY